MRKTIKNKPKLQFTDEEFNSGDGMLTTIWGPGIWHFLHTMSFNYPINPTSTDKNHYKNFILSLQNILPCGKCRENLKNNLKLLPLEQKHLKNRESFSKYIFDLHETVNTMLNKISGLTYEQVRNRYEHFRARCNNKTYKKKENGCTNALHGKKSKCVLHIVPQTMICDTLQIDKQCVNET